MRHWRIKPDDYIGFHVEQIAREENRTLANTLEKLLREAIDQRRSVDRRAATLGAIIRGAWLALDLDERAGSLDELLRSTDIVAVDDLDLFGVARVNFAVVTKLEENGRPALPSASA